MTMLALLASGNGDSSVVSLISSRFGVRKNGEMKDYKAHLAGAELWNARFAELTAYQSKNGGKTPPVGSYTLGRWVGTQRRYRKSNKLSADKIRRLDEVGFAWATSVEGPGKAYEKTWMTRFAELTAYQSKNDGKTPPAGSYTLGNWVKQQRTKRKSNSCPPTGYGG